MLKLKRFFAGLVVGMVMASSTAWAIPWIAQGLSIVISAGKTLTVSNTMTLTATDGSTLAIGTGGTLGTAAYTAATAYAPAFATDTCTMAAGVCTFTATGAKTVLLTVDTSGGAAENLTGITGGTAGMILIIQSTADARVPTIKDGGTLYIQADFAFDSTTDSMTLLCTAANTWKELTRASNN